MTIQITKPLLDTHVNYLISLIPDDDVIFHFSHELIYTNTDTDLHIMVSTHFRDDPFEDFHIDPTHTPSSIHELLKIRKKYGSITPEQN